MEKKGTDIDADYYGKGKGERQQGGDDNDDSGKGKGGDSQKGKKGNDNELPTTLFEHKEVWIVITSGWTTYGRVIWKNPLWIK